MKKLTLFFLAMGFSAIAQTTLIPDPLFEQALVDMEIDTDGVVNGQIATADAEAVTTLNISYLFGDGGDPEDYIQDVTGLEAFVNLESFTLNGTMVDDLDLSALVNLKHLYCADDMLESIDVSHNVLLETLNITSGGDLYPFNWITEVDLSHNPLINQLILWGGATERIDLRNGNNGADIMYIDISAIWAMGIPPDVILGNTCIAVDDAEAAQNGELPYSGWAMYYNNMSYNYSAACTMSIEDVETNALLYPNPANDILYVNQPGGGSIEKLQILDFSGRVVQEFRNVNGSVSLTGIAAGTYLVKVVSGQAVTTEKVVIRAL